MQVAALSLLLDQGITCDAAHQLRAGGVNPVAKVFSGRDLQAFRWRFKVTDIHADYTRLQAQGVVFTSEPVNAGPVIHRCVLGYLRKPDSALPTDLMRAAR
jgi:hypothetical protein